jgi:hypothetical protein
LKFVIRTTGEPLQFGAAVGQAMLEIEPNLPLTRLRSMEQIVARSVAQERFNMLLLGVFAVFGLLLAAIGIDGVMAYTVAQRTRPNHCRPALILPDQAANSQPKSTLLVIEAAGEEYLTSHFTSRIKYQRRVPSFFPVFLVVDSCGDQHFLVEFVTSDA